MVWCCKILNSETFLILKRTTTSIVINIVTSGDFKCTFTWYLLRACRIFLVVHYESTRECNIEYVIDRIRNKCVWLILKSIRTVRKKTIVHDGPNRIFYTSFLKSNAGHYQRRTCVRIRSLRNNWPRITVFTTRLWHHVLRDYSFGARKLFGILMMQVTEGSKYVCCYTCILSRFFETRN